MPKFLKDVFEKKGKKGVQTLLLMFLAGVLLLVISGYFASREDGDNRGEGQAHDHASAAYAASNLTAPPISLAAYLAKGLEDILSLVAGAGEVRVMLTIGNTSRIFAQNSQSISSKTTEEDSEGGVRYVESANSSFTYVMIRQNDGSEVPLLLTEIAPSIEGVIIVAQGGGDVAVRAALSHAVQALLGVAAHRVQVFEMQ